MNSSNHFPPVSPFKAGWSGRCPRCGEGHVFSGFLMPAVECDSCGLDFSFIDSGDGPAIFVMFAAGFIVVALALAVEIMFRPSMLVHLVLWIPLSIFLCIWLLRPFKGILIALQYKNDAHEAQQD